MEWRSNRVAAAYCGVAVALMLVLLACDGCANEVISETASRNGSIAVVFVRSCGATTGFGTHVSVLAAGAKLPADGGNIFIADSDHGQAKTGSQGELNVQARWAADKQLIIKYPKSARLFRSEERLGDVHVVYEPIDQ
jgi:hypothetical protein